MYWKYSYTVRVKAGTEVGWTKWNGYRLCSVDRQTIPVHHVVWYMHNDCFIDVGKDLDHINGIRDDNRIENLRGVTRSDNLMNKGGYGKTSKHRGVYKLPSGKFCVRFKKDYLGSFDSEDEAAKVWNNHVGCKSPYVKLNEVD